MEVTYRTLGFQYFFICVMSNGFSGYGVKPIVLKADPTRRLLTSPGYPNQYNSNQLCKWLIQTDSDSVVRLKVIDTDLEPSTGCGNDFVKVHDGNNRVYRTLFQWCGHRMPFLLPTSDIVLVIFKSNLRDSRRGFAMEYWSEKTVEVKYSNITMRFYQYVLFGVLGLTSLIIILVIFIQTGCNKLKLMINLRRRVENNRQDSLQQSNTSFDILVRGNISS